MDEHIERRVVTDPTQLTTKQLLREIGLLRDILEARMDCTDKDIARILLESEKIPNLIRLAITEVRELNQEKFASIQTQFHERDIRTDQTSRDSKIAVDAALQAAKELSIEQNKASSQAIAKSEMATNKQIDQIGTLITSIVKSTDEKIDDIKGRQARGEGLTSGSRTTARDFKADTTANYVIIVSIVSVVVTIFLSVVHFIKI